MFKKILVPVDGSDSSVMAATVAADMATKNNGSIKLLYVIRPYIFQYTSVDTGLEIKGPQIPGGARKLGEEILSSIKAIIESEGTPIDVEIAVGNPVEEICAKAVEDDIDLVVMGSRGIGGFKAAVLGSVSQSVSHMAHCPVLLTRLPRADKEEHKIFKGMPSDYNIYL